MSNVLSLCVVGLTFGLNQIALQLNTLTAISPVDGRYFEIVKPLSPYFSESGLMRYRIQIEIEYVIALSAVLPELEDFPVHRLADIRKIYRNFTEYHGTEIKELEKKTNHDVKAVEYYIKNEFDKLNLTAFKEFVHFGLTSQDINNTAVPLLIKDFVDREYMVMIELLVTRLVGLAKEWKDVAMLAFTHGQPASPTRLGKEIMVFAKRLEKQLSLLKTIPYSAKFGGATGNFNAHVVAYPETDWHKFADEFVQHFGLTRSFPTTQIEHYDNLAALFDNFKRINTILLDYSKDMWQYIAMEYFKQRINESETGSSTMPHKVNPIDFENAEGNLGLANAMFEHFSAKLPISRLQRDLTDSTVLRNVGVPLAHTYVAIQSLLKGISKLQLNESKIRQDLENNWAIVAEGIQTVLRREGYANPYEALKQLTRKNEKITREELHQFIDNLDVKDSVKNKLKEITPSTYTGV